MEPEHTDPEDEEHKGRSREKDARRKRGRDTRRKATDSTESHDDDRGRERLRRQTQEANRGNGPAAGRPPWEKYSREAAQRSAEEQAGCFG